MYTSILLLSSPFRWSSVWVTSGGSAGIKFDSEPRPSKDVELASLGIEGVRGLCGCQSDPGVQSGSIGPE